MEKEYAKDYPIPFHNDVFFKYMLIGDDAVSYTHLTLPTNREV